MKPAVFLFALLLAGCAELQLIRCVRLSDGAVRESGPMKPELAQSYSRAMQYIGFVCTTTHTAAP